MRLPLRNAPETAPENGGKTTHNSEQRGRQKQLLQEGRESLLQKVENASRQQTSSIDLMGATATERSSPLSQKFLAEFLKDEPCGSILL